MNSTSAMRAMIWKEFRENLKWAALGFLLTGGAFIWALWMHAGLYRNIGDLYQGGGSPLVTDEFQAITTMSGVIGLLLSLAQILPEKRLDQWAFLIHRPISRSRLFVYKVIAGVMLYLLATAVPYLLAVAWVAKPGNVPAPFVPQLMLPGVADVLAGLMYYFAGLVIGLREARWYGSRIMAAGLAVFASFVVVLSTEFWWALIAIVISISVLATAAWGCFITGGRYASQPVAAKATLGTAVFFGIVMLASLGAIFVATVLVAPAMNTSGVYEHSNYFVDDDGQIVRTTYRNNVLVSITDPAGQPIPKYAGVTDAVEFQKRAGEGIPSAGLWIGGNRVRIGYDWTSYRKSTRYFVDLNAPTGDKWYYLRGERYAVAYESRNRRPIHYAGPSGFTSADAGPPAERFTGAMLQNWQWPQYMLAFSSGAYEVNFALQNIFTVFTPPAGEQLLNVGMAQTAYKAEQESVTLFKVFAASNSLHVFAPDGKPMFSTPLTHKPADGYDQVSVYHGGEPARNIVWYSRRTRGDGRETKQDQIVTDVSPSGEVLSTQSLPPTVWRVTQPEASPEERFIGAVVPPAGVALVTTIGAALNDIPCRTAFEDPSLQRAMRTSVVSAIVFAVLAVLLTRRYAFTWKRTIGWTLGTLLLGPAGMLTLLSLNEWPRRERCPSCRHGRNVNQERCPNCGSEFAFPSMDGTEIFAT